MPNDLLKDIAESVVDVDAEGVAVLVEQALREGLEPLTIIDQALVPGMQAVGEKFASGEYFLPQLVIAGRAMQAGMKLLEPALVARKQTVKPVGTVVLGTVKGDIHEIGKTLVGTMLAANGFKVHDLGTDVSPGAFVAKVHETGADIVGLSALLTTTMTMQRKVIEAFTEAGIREQVKVIVGGAPISREWASAIGADGYAEDAVGAVRLAKELMQSR